MPRKKKEELEAEGTTAEMSQEEPTEENIVEASTDDSAETKAEDQSKKTKKAKSADQETEESSIVDSVFDTVSAAVGSVANAVVNGVSSVVGSISGNSSETDVNKLHHSKRAEKIGIVQSDKMTKTVTVRVDRVVKHPVYRKYIKRRKKFMAHDELGAAIGDKVRIIETRPLSARKRWRVVEIVQKAVK